MIRYFKFFFHSFFYCANFKLYDKRPYLGWLQEYNAKLSDFGLAKDGPIGDESHVSTRVMGTHGYAAPEYLATGTCQVLYFLVKSLFLWLALSCECLKKSV